LHITAIARAIKAVRKSSGDIAIDDRDEIMREWRESKEQAAKDARHAWIFWGVVAAAVLVWHGWRSLS
jgi:hypothetical protein